MTLRMERVRGRIRLSGTLRSEHLEQLEIEIEFCGSPVVLDLGELDLVDVEGIRFLNACEAKGILVLNRSPYISEWMLRERARARKARSRTKEDK
jgi:hypothetical protein